MKGNNIKPTRNPDFDRLVGNFLRSKRYKKGYQLSELGDIAGLNLGKASLSGIELGNQQLSSYQLFLISRALDFSIDEMFNEIEQNNLIHPKNLRIDNSFNIEEL